MDIKTGDLVRVSDSPYICSWYPVKKLLGRTPVGGYIVMSDDGSVPLSYLFAEKVQVVKEAKCEYRPYDIDTFPKGMVWVSDTERVLVMAVKEGGVLTSKGLHTYDILLKFNKISTDGGHTWIKAGVEV